MAASKHSVGGAGNRHSPRKSSGKSGSSSGKSTPRPKQITQAPIPMKPGSMY